MPHHYFKILNPGTVLPPVRLVAVIVCALLLELGWLGLWPLSVKLSHSAA
jgi:hypothetical protein